MFATARGGKRPGILAKTSHPEPGAQRGHPLHEYSPDESRPLRGYAALSTTYVTLVGAGIAAARRAGVRLPARIPTSDLVLIGVATHKASRLIAKDKVTSTLRAPFTRFQGAAGHAELDERARGTGLQMALGELVLCPYCLGMWVATAFVGGHVAYPRQARAVASVFAALTVSDFLQLAYHWAEERA